MSQRTLVTAALPYANGSIHLGHLVEYCQVDMYVRALKRLGEPALYVCADDTHGTPIEVNATKLGVSPEELVRRYHVEHQRDFARFDVAFDHFSTTNSDTNRAVVERVYAALRERGVLEDRDLDGNWCDTDKRFLPDRFIKGLCPSCGAADQYGDICEVCGKTYAPTDLKEPRCVLCGSAPVIRKSRHVFFKLSDPRMVAFLREWVDSGSLPADTANYVRGWLDSGLKDWCISRDGPYFGFAVPDRPGKYFYVWLDAPLGYIASAVEWGEKHGVGFDELWRSPQKTRVEHVIGKDIVYFHTLFWPAVLRTVGYTLPSRIHVHGMLTVDGEKMSKSRGTFINAQTFAAHIDPQALRYYYACKAGADASDLDLSFDDLIQRVNGELVNKHANLFSRVSQFLSQKLDNRLGDLPFAAALAQQEPLEDGSRTPLELARTVVAGCRRIEALYRRRELGQVVRELAAIGDVGNEYIQAHKPWDQLKSDPEAARATITFAAHVCHALAMYLWPIVPRFADAAARTLGVSIDRLDAARLFPARWRELGTFERLFERLDRKQADAVIAASRQEEPGAKATGQGAKASGQGAKATGQGAKANDQGAKATPAGKPPPAHGAGGERKAPKETVDYEQFARLDLRVGLVLKAEAVPKSKKLVRLEVDVGEGAPRQVVAGIGQVYEPAALVGLRVVVVANLAPAKLMGLESHGMVLAAGEPPGLALLGLARELPPGTEVK